MPESSLKESRFHSKTAVEIGSLSSQVLFTTFSVLQHQSWKESRSGETTEAKERIRFNKQGDREAVGRTSTEERRIHKIYALLSSLSTTSVSQESLPHRSAIEIKKQYVCADQLKTFR